MLVLKSMDLQSIAKDTELHICATVDDGEPKCYQVPLSKIEEFKDKLQESEILSHSSRDDCLKHACNSANALKLDIKSSFVDKLTDAKTSCMSSYPGDFVCSVRGKDLNMFKGDTIHAVESARAYAGGGQDSVNDQIANLAQQQRYELLGQQLNGIMNETGVSTKIKYESSWGSPFEGTAQMLGDGSAFIQNVPGAASRLLTSTKLTPDQLLSVANQRAAVTGSLDWLQQAPPFGYVNVNTQTPVNAWTLNNELAWRFPQAVLTGPPQPDVTLSEAIFTVQNNSKNITLDSQPGMQAHFCCNGRDRGCMLQAVREGTKGCYPVLGVDMLGAAESKCQLNCTGEIFQELRPDAVCFQEGSCNAIRRWQIGNKAACYASQEVCQVATAQARALNVLGSTYT